MLSKTPSYSVIIPTYNRAIPLQRAIDSIYQQNYPDIEIIIVDDGSNDNTELVISQFYTDVIFIQQPNLGPAAARNAGIKLASGELISFLDSDDIWQPGKIKQELKLFNQYQDADVISGNCSTYIQGQLDSIDTFQKRRISFTHRSPRYFDWSMKILEAGPVCFTSTLCFKRCVFEQFDFQPFDITLRFDEDWDLEFRLFTYNRVLLYPSIVCHRHINDDGTRYYYSPSGKTKSDHELRTIWQQQINIIERYLESPWPLSVKKRFIQRRNVLANYTHGVLDLGVKCSPILFPDKAK